MASLYLHCFIYSVKTLFKNETNKTETGHSLDVFSLLIVAPCADPESFVRGGPTQLLQRFFS